MRVIGQFRALRRGSRRLSLFVVGALFVPAAPADADNPFGAPRVPHGPQCYFNSDCGDGLVCGPSGVCRQQCRADRDCASGETCAASHHDENGRIVPTPAIGQAFPADSYYGICRASSYSRPPVAQPAGSALQSPAPVILPGTRTVPTAFAVAAVKLAPDVAEDKQKCPSTVRFHGWVAASGSGSVKYRMVRSDGAASMVQTLTFADTGRLPIETSWTLSSSFSGAISVEILAPNAMRAAPANFTIECLQ